MAFNGVDSCKLARNIVMILRGYKLLHVPHLLIVLKIGQAKPLLSSRQAIPSVGQSWNIQVPFLISNVARRDRLTGR